MAKNIEIRNSTAEFLIFMLKGEEDGIQVMYKNETIWATQKAISQLFDVGVPAISKHLKTSLRVESWLKIQLFPKWKQLLRMGKTITRPIIISMPLLVSDIESIQFVPLSSGSGVRLSSGSLPSVDMCLTISEWRTGLS